MDLIEYLQTKVVRCRALAAGEKGEAAAAFLEIAAATEADIVTLRARVLRGLRSARERLSRGDRD